MSRLPTVSARLMIKFLEHLGFMKSRQRGSHIFFGHPDGRTATIPYHPGEDLGRGIMNKILHDADVTREVFLDWLKKKKSSD
ncbi:MAG: type II toxin-antitoxin system HicA family toxin [Desulfobacca sp.]|nr:type II toxin-antitoxin system HicA family toxin [Desulfobacca sp.]